MTRIVAVGAVLAALAGCGGSSSSDLLVVEAGTSDRFPSETFTDWVSYADQASVFTVVGEEALPESSDPNVHGGYFGRAVTLRIDQTIWRREGAPSADGSFRVITWGWEEDDRGERRPTAAPGGPRLEVGSRYVAPLVRAPRDGADWTPLSHGATLQLEGDVITTEGIVGDASPIAKRMKGQSVDNLGAVLARTPPDPLAVKYSHLAPEQRWQAVYRERGELDY
jgi:hypothetical protein